MLSSSSIDESRPEVGVEQVPVHPLEHLKSQWAAVFLNFMHLFFKLGEHRLAKQDLPDVFDLPVDQVSPHQRFLRAFQKMMREKFFVKCRSHFGEKNRVAVVLKKLVPLRKPAMHGMPCLVGEREDMGKHIGFVVHQDIRRIPVTRRGECAASLAFGLVAVDPSGAKSVSEGIDVFGSEGIKGVYDELDCFIETDVGLDLRDQRYERVILMNFVRVEGVPFGDRNIPEAQEDFFEPSQSDCHRRQQGCCRRTAMLRVRTGNFGSFAEKTSARTEEANAEARLYL